MEKKRRITFYQDLNGPYEQMLEDGLKDTPEERYIKFFQMQNRLWALKGKPAAEKKLTFGRPSWI